MYHVKRNKGLEQFRTEILESQIKNVYIESDEQFGTSNEWWKRYLELFANVYTLLLGNEEPKLHPIFSNLDTLHISRYHDSLKIEGVYTNITTLSCCGKKDQLINVAANFSNVKKLKLGYGSERDLDFIKSLFPHLIDLEVQKGYAFGFDRIVALELEKLSVRTLYLEMCFTSKDIMAYPSTYNCLRINVEILNNDYDRIVDIFTLMMQIPRASFIPLSGGNPIPITDRTHFESMSSHVKVQKIDDERACWFNQLYSREIRNNFNRTRSLKSLLK
jgi:hypothetical protein